MLSHTIESLSLKKHMFHCLVVTAFRLLAAFNKAGFHFTVGGGDAGVEALGEGEDDLDQEDSGAGGAAAAEPEVTIDDDE